MTSQSPRIYIYKITFEEVLYYYYGVHKEKKFGEYYMGSPITHKWMWDFYTPKKQILEIFDYSDKSWIEAQEVEKRLIGPVYNTDKWCLNEHCGGGFSLQVLSKAGKRGGSRSQELGVGIHSFDEEQRKKTSKTAGEKAKELGVGIFNLGTEQLSENGKKGAEKIKELGIGIFSLTQDQLVENGKKYGLLGGKASVEKHKKNGTGFYGQTFEEKSEAGKKGGKIGGKIGGSISGKKHKENGTGIFGLTAEEKIKYGKIGAEKTNSQKWKCTETGHITNAGALTNYQRKRGIDTTKRTRIE
jgi:hypothetical protein